MFWKFYLSRQIESVNYRTLPYNLLIASSIVLLASCTNPISNKNHGPIVLGDSVTIITESDPNKLVDQVPDLKPAIEEAVEQMPVKDTTKPVIADQQPQETPAAQTQAPVGNGLNIAFKEVTIFIPNVTTRSYGNKNLQNARGASYELQSGELAGNTLRMMNGTVQKVTQRYQTVIVLKDGGDILPLESLGTYSSDWEALRGNGNSFQISGLAANQLQANKVSQSSIRNAVQQAGRRARMSRSEIADWEDIARNVRSANQAPATVLLRSVSWRIEGKDSRGRAFNKEVRIDLPR